MKTNIEKFYVIGIFCRTSNKDNQALQDITALWGRFMSENIHQKIPNKINDTVYSVYTEYEGDFTKPYTVVLGCKVSNLENIPVGMKGIIIDNGDYEIFTAKGDLHQGIIGEEWQKIWQKDLPRKYITDFEVYDERSHDIHHAEIDIYIGVR